MKITVVGTGYVGLVTGTCFADMGNHVTGVDIDEAKIKKMRGGEVPIYEPDLDNLFKRNLKEGRLLFTTDLKEGIKDAEVIFLALPTPSDEEGAADLRFVLQVADGLGPLLKNYVVIVNKSTVPVGTAERVKKHIAKNAKVPFDVVSNPEFLREGFAVVDFMKPDRVIVGSSSKKAQKIMDELYKPFVRQGNPIMFMDERSAEMTKYAANSFLATKISFMNEVANLCEKVGADVDAVRLGIGADERIGKRFLFPGIGFGGSCFPKDVKALSRTAFEHDYDFRILDAVLDVNRYQQQRLANKVLDYYKGDIEGKTFALWGLAFKPNTDDIREAPSLEIIDSLTKAGARVVAYDPEAMGNVKQQLKDNSSLSFAEDAYAALKGADGLIIATEWDLFRTPEFDRMRKLMRKPAIFDGRNVFEPELVKNHSFYYDSIGRSIVRG